MTCQVESLVYHAEPVTLGQLARVRIWVRRDQLSAAHELLRELGAAGDSEGSQD